MRQISLILFGTIATVFGQIETPTLGLVPDNGVLRKMSGIPAAGSIGAPLASSSPLGIIEISPAREISPAQSFALATDSVNGVVMLLRIAGNSVAVSATPIEGVETQVGKIVFSPNGKTAALWQSEKRTLDVLTGLPDTIRVRSVPAGSWGGAPLSFAVSDDGSWLAGAWPSGVFAFGPGGEVNLLPSAGTPQAVAFFHGRPDVAIMTDTQVLTLTHTSNDLITTELWHKPADMPADAAQIATGLALSADNQRLTITGSAGGIYTIDLSNRTGTYSVCDCKTTGLAGLGGTLYRISSLENGSLKLYDAATGDVLFVPIANGTEGGQQ